MIKIYLVFIFFAMSANANIFTDISDYTSGIKKEFDFISLRNEILDLEYSEARKKVDQIISDNPKDFRGYELKGYVDYHNKNFKSAYENYLRAQLATNDNKIKSKLKYNQANSLFQAVNPEDPTKLKTSKLRVTIAQLRKTSQMYQDSIILNNEDKRSHDNKKLVDDYVINLLKLLPEEDNHIQSKTEITEPQLINCLLPVTSASDQSTEKLKLALILRTIDKPGFNTNPIFKINCSVETQQYMNISIVSEIATGEINTKISNMSIGELENFLLEIDLELQALEFDASTKTSIGPAVSYMNSFIQLLKLKGDINLTIGKKLSKEGRVFKANQYMESARVEYYAPVSSYINSLVENYSPYIEKSFFKYHKSYPTLHNLFDNFTISLFNEKTKFSRVDYIQKMLLTREKSGFSGEFDEADAILNFKINFKKNAINNTIKNDFDQSSYKLILDGFNLISDIQKNTINICKSRKEKNNDFVGLELDNFSTEVEKVSNFDDSINSAGIFEADTKAQKFFLTAEKIANANVNFIKGQKSEKPEKKYSDATKIKVRKLKPKLKKQKILNESKIVPNKDKSTKIDIFDNFKIADATGLNALITNKLKLILKTIIEPEKSELEVEIKENRIKLSDALIYIEQYLKIAPQDLIKELNSGSEFGKLELISYIASKNQQEPIAFAKSLLKESIYIKTTKTAEQENLFWVKTQKEFDKFGLKLFGKKDYQTTKESLMDFVRNKMISETKEAYKPERNKTYTSGNDLLSKTIEELKHYFKNSLNNNASSTSALDKINAEISAGKYFQGKKKKNSGDSKPLIDFNGPGTKYIVGNYKGIGNSSTTLFNNPPQDPPRDIKIKPAKKITLRHVIGKDGRIIVPELTKVEKIRILDTGKDVTKLFLEQSKPDNAGNYRTKNLQGKIVEVTYWPKTKTSLKFVKAKDKEISSYYLKNQNCSVDLNKQPALKQLIQKLKTKHTEKPVGEDRIAVATSLTKWVNDNVYYSQTRDTYLEYKKYSSNLTNDESVMDFMLRIGRGDCDVHNSFVGCVLMNEFDIPVRMGTGLMSNEKVYGDEFHAWIQIWAPKNGGWINWDSTSGNMDPAGKKMDEGGLDLKKPGSSLGLSNLKIDLPKLKLKFWEESEMTPKELKKASLYLAQCLESIINKQLLKGDIELNLDSFKSSNRTYKDSVPIIKKYCKVQLSKKDYSNLLQGKVEPKSDFFSNSKPLDHFISVPIIDFYISLLESGVGDQDFFIEKLRKLALSAANTESEFDKENMKNFFVQIITSPFKEIHLPISLRKEMLDINIIQRYKNNNMIFEDFSFKHADLNSNGLTSEAIPRSIYHTSDAKVSQYEVKQLYKVFTDTVDKKLADFLSKKPIKEEDYNKITVEYANFITEYYHRKKNTLSQSELEEDLYSNMDRFKLVVEHMLDEFNGDNKEKLNLFLKMHEALRKPFTDIGLYNSSNSVRFKSHMRQFYSKIEPLILSNIRDINLIKKLDDKNNSLIGPPNFMNKFVSLHLEQLKKNTIASPPLNSDSNLDTYKKLINKYSDVSQWQEYIDGKKPSPNGLKDFNSMLQSMYLIAQSDPSPMLRAMTKKEGSGVRSLSTDVNQLGFEFETNKRTIKNFKEIQKTPIKDEASLKLLNQIYNFDLISQKSKERENLTKQSRAQQIHAIGMIGASLSQGLTQGSNYIPSKKTTVKFEKRIQMKITSVSQSLYLHAKDILTEKIATELRPYYTLLLTGSEVDRLNFLHDITRNQDFYNKVKMSYILNFFNSLAYLEPQIYQKALMSAMVDITYVLQKKASTYKEKRDRKRAFNQLNGLQLLAQGKNSQDLAVEDLAFITESNKDDFWGKGWKSSMFPEDINYRNSLIKSFVRQKGSFEVSKFFDDIDVASNKANFGAGRGPRFHLKMFLIQVLSIDSTRERGMRIINHIEDMNKTIKPSESYKETLSKKIIKRLKKKKLTASYKNSPSGQVSVSKTTPVNVVQPGEPAFLTELRLHKMIDSYDNLGGHDVLLSSVLVNKPNRKEKLKEYLDSPVFNTAHLYPIKLISQILQFGENNNKLEEVIPDIFRALDKRNILKKKVNRGFKDTMYLFSLYQYARPEDKEEIANILKKNQVSFDKIATSFENQKDKDKLQSSYKGLGISWEAVQKFGKDLNRQKKSQTERDIEYDQIFALTRLEQESGITQPFSKKMSTQLSQIIDKKIKDKKFDKMLILKASYNKRTAIKEAKNGLQNTGTSKQHIPLLKTVNDRWQRQFDLIYRDEFKEVVSKDNFKSKIQTEFLRDAIQLLNTNAFKEKMDIVNSNEVKRLFKVSSDNFNKLSTEEQIAHLFITFNKLFEKQNSEISNQFLLSEANNVLLKLAPRIRAQVIAKLLTNGKIISNQQRLLFLAELGMHDEVLPYLDRRSEKDGGSLNSFKTLITAVDDILLSEPSYKESTQSFRNSDNQNNVILGQAFRRRFVTSKNDMLIDQNLKNRVDFRNTKNIFEVAKYDKENFGVRFTGGDWDIPQEKKLALITKAMATGLYSPKLLTTIPIDQWRKKIMSNREKQDLKRSVTFSFIHSNLANHYGEKWFAPNGTSVLVDKFAKEFKMLPQNKKMKYLKENTPPFDRKELERMNIKLAPYGVKIDLPYKEIYMWTDSSLYRPSDL